MNEAREHCTLDDEAFEARRLSLRETLLPRVTGRERLKDGIAFSFEDSEALRRQLDRFVSLERECCGGLEFSTTSADGRLRLEILGVDPGGDFFAEFEGVGPASETDSPGRGGWRSVLRPVLGGTGFALLLCCVLSIGAVTIMGAGLAGPLIALDDPVVIGFAAVGASALLWRRQRKRDRSRSANASTDGCGC